MPKDIIFVDDRARNLETAAALGMKTVLFAKNGTAEPAQHRVATNFQELFGLVARA
jgi:FMN phosphatase YigB (HAD superfamily)